MVRRQREAGQVIVVVALSMFAVLGAVGLAIDSGLAYMARAQLNTAVDAASIAAARASTNGANQAEQRAAAQEAARDFFHANYPSGYLGGNAVLNEPVVTFDRGKVTVDVTARTTSTVSFMRMLGFEQTEVAAASQTVRTDLDMALVIDTTGSLSSVGSAVRSSSKLFLDRFNTTTDRVGLVHFATGAVVDVPIRTVQRGFDRDTMKTKINAYAFDGFTNTAEGFWHGRNQLKSIAQSNRSSLRVIVLFSDGSPNSFSSTFTFNSAYSACSSKIGTIISQENYTTNRTIQGLNRFDQINSALSGCYADDVMATNMIVALPNYYNAHGPTADDPATAFPVVTNSGFRPVTNSLSSRRVAWTNINRAARNLVEAMADKARSEDIYVFTLGLGANLKSGTGPDNEPGEEVLKCLANTPDAPTRCRKPAQPSGLYCYAATTADLTPCFSRLASEILRLTK
jgi:Flp pilus assembly protein TadG